MRQLRIGITVGLSKQNESIWLNGIKQNALFLAKVLKASPANHVVTILNTTDVSITQEVPWDINEFNTGYFNKSLNDLDVLIELGGQISIEHTLYLKSKGTKVVSYCCGVEYFFFLEKLLADKRVWPNGLVVNKNFDALWFIPQVANTTLPYLQTLRRTKTEVVPFVWDPMFVDKRAKDFPNNSVYIPKVETGRVSVFEPNINFVKTSFFPIFIAELAYRTNPELFTSLHVCSSKGLAENNKDFQMLMRELDIVQGNKAFFVDRWDTVYFLANHTDVVISHQIENPLNYFYFDTCWLGYPLLHNASMCSDLGYYYNGNDVEKASKRLVDILKHHNNNYEAYTQTQRSILKNYTSHNTELVEKYDKLLSGLYEK